MTAGLDSLARAPAVPEGSLRDDPITLEGWGWSSQPESCAPKIEALASLFNLAPPDPVARVNYASRGNLLVIAGEHPDRARAIGETLGSRLNVTLIAGELRPTANCTAWSGELAALEGYLGEFTATVEGLRVGDGAPAAAATPAKFDLVLDFSAVPRFAMRQPPQGYFRAPADDAALQALLPEIGEAIGEFEKPRYFAYRENLCAHSRSEVTGCNACIEVCSTEAIHAKGDHVEVDPHLCMGCGACATVCPSGAMTYQWPRVADRGAQLKQLLSTYRNAGGENAAIVFHDGREARELLARAATEGAGLPPRMLPLEAWHVASIGLDLLMPAIAFGATQVILIASGREDPVYVEALREQMAIGQAVLSALGYAGTHFSIVQADEPASLERQLAALQPAAVPAVNGTFLLGNDKRTAIEFAVEHLVRHAPTRVDEIALPEGAPWGEIRVAKDKCTMCMACVGACPESALMDGVDVPLLKFLERNCVQCGLCANTCPEDAITLHPRLLLTPAVREARVVNETQPFHCIKCQKAFGTRQMVETMMGRLAAHKMFTGGDALKRLQMCADCRVIDMMSAKDEVSVLRLGDRA